ncbi:MAG: indole-3-glycerol phosphate synthase TrpC [Thermoanaerobaculia bacterium]
MSDVLTEILAAKRSRLSRGEYGGTGKAARPTDGPSFAAALRESGTRIVAEIKAKSPSAGEILHGADGKIESFALLYRRGRAAAISVVTEEDFFGGRPEWVPRAKSISGLPVLMKDFVVSERQLDFAVSLGADAVLLIVRALSDEELAALRRGAKERGLAAVVEAHDAAQIRRAAAADPDVLGVNARDLSTFSTDLDALAAMAKEIPPGPVRLAESGIRTRDEIVRLTDAGFQAFLVGETLLRAEDPEEELRSLRG